MDPGGGLLWTYASTSIGSSVIPHISAPPHFTCCWMARAAAVVSLRGRTLAHEVGCAIPCGAHRACTTRTVPARGLAPRLRTRWPMAPTTAYLPSKEGTWALPDPSPNPNLTHGLSSDARLRGRWSPGPWPQLQPTSRLTVQQDTLWHIGPSAPPLTVFPLPGGPCSSTPRGGRIRRPLNRWGARRGSATSSRSAAVYAPTPPSDRKPSALCAARPVGGVCVCVCVCACVCVCVCGCVGVGGG